MTERRSSDDSDSGDADSGDATDSKKRRKKGEDEGAWVPDEMDEDAPSQDRDRVYLSDIKAVLGSPKYKVRIRTCCIGQAIGCISQSSPCALSDTVPLIFLTCSLLSSPLLFTPLLRPDCQDESIV